jgi:hypothetical protein
MRTGIHYFFSSLLSRRVYEYNAGGGLPVMGDQFIAPPFSLPKINNGELSKVVTS